MKLLPALSSFIIFIIVIAIPPAILSYSAHAGWLIPRFWAVFAFISGLTFITVVSIVIVGRLNPGLYAQVFLAATTVKILTALFFALFFLQKIAVNRYAFVADFFYIYILNMVFEIYTLLRNLRNQNSQ